MTDKKKLDVICEFARDGRIIPMRIRLMDDDGQFQAYTIKRYREISGRGTYTTPDGVFVTNSIIVFDCRIEVFGSERSLRLYYNISHSEWSISA